MYYVLTVEVCGMHIKLVQMCWETLRTLGWLGQEWGLLVAMRAEGEGRRWEERKASHTYGVCSMLLHLTFTSCFLLRAQNPIAQYCKNVIKYFIASHNWIAAKGLNPCIASFLQMPGVSPGSNGLSSFCGWILKSLKGVWGLGGGSCWITVPGSQFRACSCVYSGIMSLIRNRGEMVPDAATSHFSLSASPANTSEYMIAALQTPKWAPLSCFMLKPSASLGKDFWKQLDSNQKAVGVEGPAFPVGPWGWSHVNPDGWWCCYMAELGKPPSAHGENHLHWAAVQSSGITEWGHHSVSVHETDRMYTESWWPWFKALIMEKKGQGQHEIRSSSNWSQKEKPTPRSMTLESSPEQGWAFLQPPSPSSARYQDTPNSTHLDTPSLPQQTL